MKMLHLNNETNQNYVRLFTKCNYGSVSSLSRHDSFFETLKSVILLHYVKWLKRLYASVVKNNISNFINFLLKPGCAVDIAQNLNSMPTADR